MVTRTSEPIDSIKTLLILAERGYGDDPRGIVVRKPARQVCGVNGEFQTPFRTVRGDVSQKFLGIANQEVSISRSVPHGEVHKCEALFVVGEQVFRYFLKMLHLVSQQTPQHSGTSFQSPASSLSITQTQELVIVVVYLPLTVGILVFFMILLSVG